MIRAVSLRNFQSWPALDMSLAPVTVLIGKGNVGKSAIVRAITYALTNQGGDSFIRHGADETRVLLELDGDRALLWQKQRGKGAVYHTSIGDETREYTKTGQTVPDEVAGLTGFRAIPIDKSYAIYPQLQGQFDGPFVIGESGSKVARILGKFTKLDVLVQAQLLARRDMSAARKEAEQAAAQAEALELELSWLPDIEALKEQYRALIDKEQEARDTEGYAHAAETLVASYKVALRKAGCDPTALTHRASDIRGDIEDITVIERAVAEHRAHVSGLADAGTTLDRAVEAVEKLRPQLDAACRELGVCDACPWR